MACALGAAACEVTGADSPRVGSVESALHAIPLDSQTFALTVDVPDGVAISDVAVEARGNLSLGANARVQTTAGAGALLTNLGAPGTQLGTKAFAGSVISTGPVSLQPKVVVDGGIRTLGTVSAKPGAIVTGAIEERTVVGIDNVLTLRVSVPGGGQGAVVAQNHSTIALSPDSYATVQAKPHSTVVLRAGEYWFGSLDLAPNSLLSIDDSMGAVFVHVLDYVGLAGEVARAQGAGAPDLLVTYLGIADIDVHGPFRGTLLAPRARARLLPGPGARHEGAFFARDVEVSPNVAITQSAFPWSLIQSDLPADVIDATDAPVLLIATVQPDGTRAVGEVDQDTSVDFEIPSRLEVEVGNAGDGVAELRFSTAGGPEVTCTYRGGAASMPPVGSLERARGEFFGFSSCDDGALAGEPLSATHFELELSTQNPDGRVSVVLSLGPGCRHSLGRPMDPEDSILLRDSFEWAATSPLPETDSKGRPNVYYFNVYVHDPRQLEYFEVLQLHFRHRPLFESEQPSQYADSCGASSRRGDGEGVFVYALAPAALYNVIRAAILDPTVPRDGSEFIAMPQRPIPAPFRATTGALDYDAVGRVPQFAYRHPALFAPEPSGVEKPFLGDIIRGAGDIASGIANGVRAGLGEVDKAIEGSVNVTVELEIANRSDTFHPLPVPGGFIFGGEMRRVWGPRASEPMKLDGVTVQVDTSAWDIVEYNTGNTNSQGIARTDVVEGSSMNEICVHMKNDAARVTDDDFWHEESEWCDTRDTGDMNRSRRFLLRTDNWRMHVLNQLTDGYHYLREVADHKPHRAIVNAGGRLANFMPRAIAPCLDFESGVALTALESIAAAAGLGNIFALGFAFNPEVDIFLPSDLDHVLNGRGVAAHEYGHYAMCSLAFEADAPSIEDFVFDRTLEGADLDPGNETGVLLEAFADFFAMQTAGGVNYFSPEADFIRMSLPAAEVADNSINYCVRPAPPIERRLYCLERNFDETDARLGTEFDGRSIGWMASLFHDFFDGHDGFVANQPNSGQAWILRDDLLVPVGWQVPAFGGDESVALGGPRLKTWFDRWRNSIFDAVSYDDVLGGLSQAAADHGMNWCDQCKVFGLHDSSVDVPFRDGLGPDDTIARFFDACRSLPISRRLVGEAPPTDDPLLITLDCRACAPGEIPIGNVCMPMVVIPPPCPDAHREVNANCVPCPSPTDVVVDNVCISCPPDRPFYVVNGGVCVDACPPGTGNFPPSRLCLDSPR